MIILNLYIINNIIIYRIVYRLNDATSVLLVKGNRSFDNASFSNENYSFKVVLKTIFMSGSRGVFTHYYNGGTYNRPNVGWAVSCMLVRIGAYCSIPTRIPIGQLSKPSN